MSSEGKHKGKGGCKRRKLKELLDLEQPPLDLTTITSPNREQRAHGTNVYYGKASQLLQDAKTRSIEIPDRKFSQSGGCVLNFYLAVRINTIRDAVVIYNAPVGCSSSALGYRELFGGVPEALG